MSTLYRLFQAVLILALGFNAVPAQAVSYSLQTVIAVPASADNNTGGKFTSFDTSFFDPLTQLDYVADRSNASIDIFSAITNTFVGRIGGSVPLFAGATAVTSTSGPNGLLVVDLPGQQQVWAGDGNSTLKGFNLPSETQFADISTGGTFRVDLVAFDPGTKYILAVNNADTPAFVTLIDSTTNAIVKKINFDGTGGTPNAIAGIVQPAYDPVTGKFYVAVPQIGNSGPGGIVEIDPATGNVLHVYDLSTFFITSCSPTGLVAGTGGRLLMGCGDSTSGSIIFDPTANGGNGAVVAQIAQIAGVDEVAFDPANNLYFLAASNNPGGPVLGIIDGLTNTFLQNVPTTLVDHSVAVDPISGEVFVPFAGIAGNTICPLGCIGVFSTGPVRVPEPSALVLFGVGLLTMSWLRRQRGAR